MMFNPSLKKRGLRRREPISLRKPKTEQRSIWDGKRYRTVYTIRHFEWVDSFGLYFSRKMLDHAASELALADLAIRCAPKEERARTIRFFTQPV